MSFLNTSNLKSGLKCLLPLKSISYNAGNPNASIVFCASVAANIDTYILDNLLLALPSFMKLFELVMFQLYGPPYLMLPTFTNVSLLSYKK
jgi:hypothetical protein|nr:MAG TPA: hypothetical protein [Caudoviricetes sp.]